MSYKIGMILSLVFVAIYFLFGADLICIQGVYSSLDSKSINISYVIARNGVVDETFKNWVNTTYKVDFELLSESSPEFGDTVTYAIYTSYDPLVIADHDMKISITRSTVIGYFN